MTAQVEPLTIRPGEKPTAEDLLRVGIAVSAEESERDSGVTFGSLCSTLSTEDLIEFRWALNEHLPAYEPSDHETVASVGRWMRDVIEAEIGGRWVGHNRNHR